MNDFPNRPLAGELIEHSEREAAATPMHAVLDAAQNGRFSGEHCFRLLARLWTLSVRRIYEHRSSHTKTV